MSASGGRPTLRSVAPWIALLAVAAAWRWLQWSRSAALFNDGPLFLGAAQAIAEGRWADALGQPHHPLYPLAVALVHGLGLGWEDAGAAVSIAGGVLAVACTTWLARAAFGATAGWVAGALLALHSRAVEYSSDVQSDGLYLGLFAAALAIGWRALSLRSPAWASASGALAGLAYLTRPEGLGAALAVAVAAAIAWRLIGWRASEALRVAAPALLAAALVAAPYALALGGGGAPTLTQKKSVGSLSGVAPQAPLVPPPRAAPPPGVIAPAATPLPPRIDRGEEGLAVARARSDAERAWEALRMEARTAKSAFRYGPLLLLAVGLFAARGAPGLRGAYVLAVVGIYTAVLYGLTVQAGYVSRRHALPPMLPLFGYAGLGAWWIGARLARRRPRGTAIVAGAIAAAVALGEAAGQVEPRRAEERAAVEAARWLRANGASGSLVTDRLRLGYYAGMPYVPFVRADDAALRSYLDRVLDPASGQTAARYVLLDDPDDVAAARRAAGERLKPIHRVERGGREAWIFERVEPGARE